MRASIRENHRKACEAKKLFDNFLAYTEGTQPTSVAAD